MSIILYFILFIFLIVIFFFFSISLSILNIFRKKSKQNQYNKKHDNASSSDVHQHKKVFGKEEGEYVDYEEIE